MATERDRRHIFVPTDWRAREPYTSHRRDFSPAAPPPPGGRPDHGATLSQAIRAAAEEARNRRESSRVAETSGVVGVYLEFQSFPGMDLAVKSMEMRGAADPRRHIEVVAVSNDGQTEPGPEPQVERATVFVPEERVQRFLDQLAKYANPTPREKGERRHENVYDRVEMVRLAVLRSLWTDTTDTYPTTDHEKFWWEVWLRRTDGAELERLRHFCAHADATVSPRRLVFDDRIVTLVQTSAHTLAAALDVMADLAELRRAKETATFFVNEKPREQAAWVQELASRTTSAPKDAPAVCILDTGVNAGHPLLEGSLAPEDCHAYDPSWGVHDHHGHGTEMAGLALYGDLVEALAGTSALRLRHRLESMKILPPKGNNEPDLYGAVTAEATARPEAQAPSRPRVFSMAVTTKDSRDRGQPTSWSAAVDALAAGRSIDPIDGELTYLDEHEDASQRLFVISAGNIAGDHDVDHLARSDVESVHDPAQAWNAITVGSFTDKDVIRDKKWRDWTPVAQRGELSPWSTTSVVFQPRWPNKPDVVFEGGNLVHNEAEEVDFPCDDLCLLTTHYKPMDKPLVSTWATSASTAQAARFCAAISAEYPRLWPETVRALMVHSAEWTPAMHYRFESADGKRSRARLLRRYGYGVPNLARALHSASDAVTLVAEDVIHPFEVGRMREIHFHTLPWPRAALADLGEVSARVRVTLSYFVEPNPGRLGWRTKHRYQSHGLRFEMIGGTEDPDTFRKRVNKAALEEDEKRPSDGADNDGWYLGPRARNRGSLHSDVFEATGADVAEKNMVAVYPVTGWWKELKKRDRSAHGARYALVVSIETDALDTNIWTPVANMVGVEVIV